MLGAGCFWGVEYRFKNLKGVVKTIVGYSGGSEKFKNPSYEEVCSNKTGHAEVVYIEYDTNLIDLKTILDVFWRIHDPTTKDMQWPDVGNQYRSAIYYFEENQKKIINNSIKELKKLIPKKIVSEIKKASEFYEAEEYHQDYVKKHGTNSCHFGLNPYLK